MRTFGIFGTAGLLCAAALGQTLKAPVSEAKVQEPQVFAVQLESPQGKAPTALQWELAIPPVLEVAPADITAGKAAESAGKSVSCAAKPGKTSTAEPLRFACILAGGVKPIDNGVVASVRYRVRTATDGAPIRVGIENILAVFLDLREFKLPNIDAVIRVR
jgi:hypothetical protein